MLLYSVSGFTVMRHFFLQNLANAKFMNLELDDRPIEHKPSTKLLGVHIDEMLTWDNQIKHISSKVSNGLRMLYLARKLTDNQETLKTIYYSLVQPYFDYCDVVWGDCSKTRADKFTFWASDFTWSFTWLLMTFAVNKPAKFGHLFSATYCTCTSYTRYFKFAFVYKCYFPFAVWDSKS